MNELFDAFQKINYNELDRLINRFSYLIKQGLKPDSNLETDCANFFEPIFKQLLPLINKTIDLSAAAKNSLKEIELNKKAIREAKLSLICAELQELIRILNRFDNTDLSRFLPKIEIPSSQPQTVSRAALYSLNKYTIDLQSLLPKEGLSHTIQSAYTTIKRKLKKAYNTSKEAIKKKNKSNVTHGRFFVMLHDFIWSNDTETTTNIADVINKYHGSFRENVKIPSFEKIIKKQAYDLLIEIMNKNAIFTKKEEVDGFYEAFMEDACEKILQVETRDDLPSKETARLNAVLSTWKNYAKLTKIVSVCHEYARHLDENSDDETSSEASHPQGDEQPSNSKSKKLTKFTIGETTADKAWKVYVNNKIIKKAGPGAQGRNAQQRFDDINKLFSGEKGNKVKHILNANRDTYGSIAFKSIVNILTFGMPVLITGRWLWNSDGQMVEKAIAEHTANLTQMKLRA